MTRSTPLALLPTLLLPVMLLTGCVYAPIDLDLGNLGKVQEVAVIPGNEDEKVLLLRIDGEISGQPQSGFLSSSPSLVSRVITDLERARKDPAIKGVIVRIDSPGGGVTASDLIYHELKRFKDDIRVPVVAWFGETAASGGYYVAMAADSIVSSPTTITGSIGVISQVIQVHELAEKVGVSVDSITSGANKDLGSPFRPMRDDERALLQELIDQMYGRFVDIVVKGREGAGLTREQVLKLADGRVYTGPQALEQGLVDKVGYLEDALLELTQRGNFRSVPQVIVYEESGFGGAPTATRYGATAGGLGLRVETEGGLVLDVARRLLPTSGPALQYLWTPGR